MKKTHKTTKKLVKKSAFKFNETLPKKIFKQTKIKNLPATNRTFFA